MNKNWAKENPVEIKAKIILFLTFPLLAFFYSIKRINTKSSYAIAFLFSVLFGLAYTVSDVRTEGSYDGITYRINFEENKKTADEYYNGLKEFFKFDDGPQDYYFETVCYYVSQVTDNYHVMFMVLAIVLAFFQLKSLCFFTSNIEEKSISYKTLLLLFLFTYIQIYNINGCRFWTAYWIGMYALLQIFYNKKPQYILLAAITPFFHGSYWLYVGMLFVIFLLKRFEKVWLTLLIISIFTSSISLQLAQDHSALLPYFLARKIEYYTDSEYIQSIGAGSGFYFVQLFFDTILPIFINLFVIYIYKFRDKLGENNRTLLQVLLIWATISNFCVSIPSLGNRFFTLTFPIIAILAYKLRTQKVISQLIYFIPIAFMYKIFRLLVDYNEIMDFTFYVSNPFYIIYNSLSTV